MATTMKAAVLHGREDIRIEHGAGARSRSRRVDRPRGRRPDLRNRSESFRRGYHARMIVPPALFGHELAGTVVEAGEGVDGFAPGDRVVALNSAPCGQCYFCERGQENLCDDLLFNNGAYAEFIRIPARIVAKNTLRIPDHVPLEHAALTEPLACAVHGFEDSRPHPGDTVAVIGGGPLGLMILHVAALAGCEVIAIVKHDGQSGSCPSIGRRARGADRQVFAKPSGRRARSRHADRGVDIAIEAVGMPESLGGSSGAGAQRRHRQLLRRMRGRNARHARYQPDPLQRHHAARHLPSHARPSAAKHLT